MSIVFWLNDEAVLSLDNQSMFPRAGEKIRLDLLRVKPQYFMVHHLVWSYRQIQTAFVDGLPMEDHRLEVYLIPYDPVTPYND